MAGIFQNGEKRLIFIVVPQVRTKLREKLNEKQHEVVKGKYANIYPHVQTPTDVETHIHTVI